MRVPVAAGLAGLVLLLGCAGLRQGGPADGHPPVLGDTPTATLEWRGVARGPLGALGPRADVHLFLRADAVARAELRYEPEDGPPVHEVLVWTDDTALLFDLRTGRYTDLGERPGRVDALGAAFAVRDAAWLLTGRRVGTDPADWSTRDGEWRGRASERGWRRPRGEPFDWTELVWRDGASVRTLRARVEAHDPATGFPRTLRLEGDGLEAPIVLDAAAVHMHPALGDSILDPLWEPPVP